MSVGDIPLLLNSSIDCGGPGREVPIPGKRKQAETRNPEQPSLGGKIPLFIMEALCEARQWQEKVAGQPLPG